ncbi:TolC family protein [Sulfurimonas sp. SAG-AH-194-C21]|nr:TolC family protein [Sulfurimonas sp. SAG-AH-194-C21]MDF1883541.1 TolC family protein [Sulfurimonas sp. SAG-AH-194-C21]
MRKILCLLALPLLAFSKVVFVQETIQEYLNEKNPYYYATIAKESISRENEKVYQSAFDTQFNMKYDNKRYPTTQGEYQQVDVTKSIGNGMEFRVAYRNAQGTQEYNNIKTGKEGEVYTSINIPVLSLLNNTSKNELDYKVAQLKTQELSQGSRKNILSLYFISSKVYFELLLYKSIYQTETDLLHKAELNYDFISKEVKSGKLAKIAIIDVKSQIINRKQRLLSSKNQYQNSKNTFLKYINIQEETFDTQYTLPSIKIESESDKGFSEGAQEIAIKNRPEFQRIEYQLDKLNLQTQYNDISKYPKFNMKLDGVYDLEYKKDGYKIAMEFNFPLERSDFKGRNETYKKEMVLLKNTKETIKNDIETNIRNIRQKISLEEKNIKLADEEIDLVKQLESAERRRYQEGLGSLLFVNQREILTLKAKQKQLHYYFELQLLHLQLKYELGTLLKKS